MQRRGTFENWTPELMFFNMKVLQIAQLMAKEDALVIFASVSLWETNTHKIKPMQISTLQMFSP
jgi:hypothetical protein